MKKPLTKAAFLKRTAKEAAKIVESGASIVYIRSGNRKDKKEYLVTRGTVVGYIEDGAVYVGVSLCKKGEKFVRHIGIVNAFNKSRQVFDTDGGYLPIMVTNSSDSSKEENRLVSWELISPTENFHRASNKSFPVQHAAEFLTKYNVPRSTWNAFLRMVQRMGRRCKIAVFPGIKKTKAVKKKVAAKKVTKKKVTK